MMCCTRYCAVEALFNSKVAKRDQSLTPLLVSGRELIPYLLLPLV